MKVETAGLKGAKFAVRVRRFGHGRWPSVAEASVFEPRLVAETGRRHSSPVAAPGPKLAASDVSDTSNAVRKNDSGSTRRSAR